jgi:hypothetical protein
MVGVASGRENDLMKSSLRNIAIVLAGLIACPSLARADQMEWTITSDFDYQVQIEFYSQSRNVAWPGNGRAYPLNDYQPHSFTLNCISGEKICYGAWPTGGDTHGRYRNYWGVGANNQHGCDHCCGICGVDDPDMRLVEGGE